MSFCEKKIVWDLEICRRIELLREADGVILYGAGEKGRDLFGWLRDAKVRVDYFCDMDLKKWGKRIEGAKILSPFQMKRLPFPEDAAVYILACIQQPQELQKLLAHLELEQMRLVTWWGIQTALHIHREALYGKDSRRFALLETQNGWQKNKYVQVGLDLMRSYLAASPDTVWIVQPGKTASTSVEARLKKKGVPFIKEHYLEYPDHILGEAYRAVWEKGIGGRKAPLKMIAAVREPLSRDYSAFWQAFTEGLERILLMPLLTNDFQKMYESYVDLILGGSTYTREKLGISMPYTWNDELEWFDEQIKKHLEIDVFQHPFDRKKGYTVIEEKGVKLFLFKVEKMEKIMDALADFVGVRELPGVNANVAEQKWYGMAYAQFRKELRLPEEYVRHYYHGNSKMDYFYTQDEKDEFLELWRMNRNAGIG